MAELKWKTEPPVLYSFETAEEFIIRLVQWIREQEREPDHSVEATVAVGGLDVAQRLNGFEGLLTGYTPPELTTLVAAPAAGKRRIIINGLFHLVDNDTVEVFVDKGGTEAKLVEFVAAGSHSLDDSGHGLITLDAIDEALKLRVTAGTGNVGYSGSFLEVD